ncbi:3-dehydroquinate synthase [Candidatus Pelagibacter sp.]|nr:3-dehydroquinate synthase [Candidatus Pelagibacter sp.]
MIQKFKIEKTNLKVYIKNYFIKNLKIKSFPRNYDIEFNDNISKIKKNIIQTNSISIIDKNIYNKYFKNIKNKRIIKINAKEKYKNLKTINKILKFFVRNKVTKKNQIFAVGGGIIQDLAGYSCLVYKRGLYWEYIPTTYLGMTDSCVGGKVGINFGNAKNLAGLFSAPRKVIINLNFLKTLNKKELLSGLGESVRLHMTGGKYFIKSINQNIEDAIKNKKYPLKRIIINSLLVKRAVVEEDEYEFNIRRSMNFGHSCGHALEILSKYKLSHGTAVMIGMCLESIVSHHNFGIKKDVVNSVITLASKILTNNDLKIVKSIQLKNLNTIMYKDKKTLAGLIKLTVPKKEGEIKFFNQKLNKKNIEDFKKAKYLFLKILNEKNSN